MLFPDVKRRRIRFFLYMHTCLCMHTHRCLNELEDLIFTFPFGRSRAIHPETLPVLKASLSNLLCFPPRPAVPSFPWPSGPALMRLSPGPPELVVVQSGWAALLGVASWSPPQAPSPWKPQAALQAVLRGPAGAGRGNQSARRPGRALDKASSVIAGTEMKNVINLRHPGER